MKVKIEHVRNTYNYGSFMMAINTLNKLDKAIENIEIYVDTVNDADFNRLVKETGIEKLKKASELNKKCSENRIIKAIKMMKLERKMYDAKIILGGDDISEYYGKKQWMYYFPLMWREASKLPTILLGQTIGPFTSYRRILGKYALNKTKIYTRDTNCLAYLKNMGVNTAFDGRDLALLQLPNSNINTDIINKYNLKKSDYITIVPSGLSKWYTNNLENYIVEQLNIIYKMLNNEKIRDKKIVLLPHVLRPNHVDDRNIIREIMKRIDKEYSDRIIAIDDEMLASEAREILSNGVLTITGRMHAAISTLFMRKPAISLSYSVKYAGVIGEGLDLNELIIECSNDDLWETFSVSNLVDEKVSYIMENYDELIEKIENNVNEASRIVDTQLDDLVKFLNNISDDKTGR